MLNETAGGKIAYKIQLPETGALNYNNHVLIDDTATMRLPVESVAYYVEATRKDTGAVEYVYASMEGLTINPAYVGMPLSGQFVHQKNVENLTVRSNAAGVTEVTNSAYGNVEIWRNSYSNNSGTGTNPALPKSDGKYDFNDYRTGSVGDKTGFGSFQIHNHKNAEATGAETVFAVNNWSLNGGGSTSVDFGMGNNPAAVGSPNTASSAPHLDWTFDSSNGGTKNRANYSDITMYAIVKSAYAPGMKNVASGSDYTVAQAFYINDMINNRMNTYGTNYFIDNTKQMQTDGLVFDRVGYYMEYINPASPEQLYYAYVSMDAFTTDVTKLGVPDAQSGFFYNQVVNNLEITTNIPATEGILTVGGATSGQRSGTAKRGSLEFWAANYGQGRSFNPQGSSSLYDISDSISAGWKYTDAGHGSMQIHNLDTEETVMAMNSFNATPKQFGIGNNPNPAANGGVPNGSLDWTFHNNKAGYQIANMYMFVREADAALVSGVTTGYSIYQRDVYGKATVDISGSFATKDGINIQTMQYSLDDGQTWVNMTNLEMKADGTFSGDAVLSTGWHDVSVRALDGGGAVLTNSISGGRVGVGEVFITAGQSNAANHGDSQQTTGSRNVVALNTGTKQWQIANDPQPGATGTAGSTWPAFGDYLSAALLEAEKQVVPVGVVSVAVGGSPLSSWNPKTGANYSRLENAILTLKEDMGTDFAGILWHQGETDAHNLNTSRTDYANMLTDLIEASRKVAEDAGWDANGLEDWDLPWIVALVSANANGVTKESITGAQEDVINDPDLGNVFLGPKSDTLLGDYRGAGSNGIHFSEKGLDELGRLWSIAAAEMIELRGTNAPAASSATPEPATWAMLLLGCAAVAVTARRRKK